MSKLEGFKDSMELRSGWYNRTARVAVGHYKAAESLTTSHRWLSGISVVLSAMVGTAVFATVQEQPEVWMKVLAGFMSVAAAVLAGLASTMGLSDKAERHRVAGAKYNAIGRELEQRLLTPEIDESDLDDIRRRLDVLAVDMPHIPKRVHKEIDSAEDVERWGAKKKNKRFICSP